MEVGPVELVLPTFPGERVDPAVAATVADVVGRGYVTMLDLMRATRDAGGEVRLTDVDRRSAAPVGAGPPPSLPE